MDISLDEFNKSRKNDAVLEDNEQKSTACETSTIQRPVPYEKYFKQADYYFNLMERIHKTLDESDEIQKTKPTGIEQEGASKIWCKCYKCGEKSWYRTGPFKTPEYVSCDYCGGDLYDVLGKIVENQRVFSS